MAARSPSFIPVYYAPDIDQSWDVNPGVLNTIQNYVPTRRGTYANFANGPSQDVAGITPWAIATYGSPCTGYVFKAVSGATASARMFVLSNETHYRIVELTAAGAVTDRSKSGTDYSACTQWTMTAAGNAILACNGVTAMQVSTSAAFSDLGGGAPTGALCLESNFGFVLAGNKGDGTNADSVGWSALGNYASWTPSLATQAGNYRLLDTPGPIRALVKLRDSVIAYKDDSIYVGDYIADTINGVIWSWRVISDKVGCSSPHGVAVLNNTHYFLHRTGVYAFDGAQVTSIGAAVSREAMRLLVDFSGLSTVQTGVDEQEGIVYFGFTNRFGVGHMSYLLMLNVNTGRWGGCMRLASTADERGTWHESSTGQFFYGFMHCTVGDLLQWTTTGAWLQATGSAPVCIGTADQTNAKLRMPKYGAAVALTSSTAIMISGWMTVGPEMTFLEKLIPRLSYFGTQTTTPAAIIYHLRREGDGGAGPSAGVAVDKNPTWNADNNCFDGSGPGYEDRCLQFQTTFAGPHELAGFLPKMKTTGKN